MPDTSHLHDVVIVGSGPAGYSAAIYTARAGFDTVVVEGHVPGGALGTAGVVDNYPGFAQPVSGPRLACVIRDQAKRFGAQFHSGDAEIVDLDGAVKVVATTAGHWRARSLILAMGAVRRPLDVPGEKELLGHGVSVSAKHDGADFVGREVAVVGGGDAAIEEALFLAPLARRATLIHRHQRLRAVSTKVARLRSLPNIVVLTSTEVLAVQGESHVTGLRIRSTDTAVESDIAVAAVFVAVGQRPRTELLRGLLALDARGHILTPGIGCQTSVQGIFAAGDVIDHRYRQAVTAAAAGCRAALDAGRWLTKHEAGVHSSPR